jgi:Glycosyl hydrolases family 2, sugar binding domain/Glycosyl hydrolases family 2, TIM barrel domain
MLFSTSLEGTWSFALDPDGRGVREQWFKRTLDDAIRLPGSVDEARKTPLTGERTMAHLSRRHPYVGQAWYMREFEVGTEADGLCHFLALERPHGEVNVWLDGFKVGRDESLSTENRFFLGPLKAGRHRLAMMIDNDRFEAVGEAIVGENKEMVDVAHSKTDHTQTNWNGVVGYLRVEACRASIACLDVFAPTRDVRIRLELEAFDPDIRFPTFWTEPGRHELSLAFEIAGRSEPLIVTRDIEIASAYTPVEIDVELPPDAAPWDEFDPVVHRVTAEWRREGVPQDKRTTTFGIRSFVAEEKRLKLNGRPVFLRGTLDCCIFPLTGYPPTDHDGWRKVFGTVKAYGLNHVRYHSYCPPKAAFEVADEMGILLHVETPVWPVLGADPNLDRYIHAEAERIVREYGNHPSFVMLCVGNEVHGARLHAFLERFMEKWKALDSRRVYTGGSGWPTTMRADYVSKPEPRNQRWLDNLEGRLNARPLETLTDWNDWRDQVPMALVSHETGQWCVYPNLEEIGKYSGVLEARNFLIVRDDLEKKGRLHLAHDFMMASGALQTRLYKEEMEAALRTRDMAGTQLLGLQDFPGQGTALVGVVDSFWDEKPYVTPAEFREFCAPVVPLIRAGTFTLTSGEPFKALVQLAQYGPRDLADAELTWTLNDQKGASVVSGVLRAGQLATGRLHDVGRIEIATDSLPFPAEYELVVGLEGTEYRNRWSLWVFEPNVADMTLPIVGSLDEASLERIAAGETLILSPEPQQLRPNAVLGHTTIFWNTLWTRGQEPHTLGLLNDPAHPLLQTFPARSHSDWHWWELIFHRRAFDIEGAPFRPIVRVIDDWNKNRDLALVAEARIGRGRLVLCAADITSDLGSRPVARSFRNALAAYIRNPAADAPELTVREASAWWERVRA